MDLKMMNAADYTDAIEALNAIGTDGLTERYGIKVSQNENYPNLYVLNYHQIDSAKFKDHPVVVQCRSLVVEYIDLGWRIASRAFDRFFNYGELANDEYVNINELTAYEKVDGSLVSVFFYNGEWLYRTKSMLMPAADIQMNSGRSWKELIESTIDTDNLLNLQTTYIFEVVSRDNRVVTRYDGDQAYLLAMRHNESGEYASYKSLLRTRDHTIKNIKIPMVYRFTTMEDCLKASTELPNLEEGYVMYNKHNEPVMKIKSPAYVAAHRLRGESVLTPKRILEMYRIGEDAEYLAIFPEDTKAFSEVAVIFDDMLDELYSLWYDKFMHINDQKEYALEVMKDCKQYQGFMFQKKKNRKISFNEMVDNIPINKLVEILGYR